MYTTAEVINDVWTVFYLDVLLEHMLPLYTGAE